MVECRHFGEKERAPPSDGVLQRPRMRVKLVGADADWVVAALEEFAGHSRLASQASFHPPRRIFVCDILDGTRQGARVQVYRTVWQPTVSLYFAVVQRNALGVQQTSLAECKGFVDKIYPSPYTSCILANCTLPMPSSDNVALTSKVIRFVLCELYARPLRPQLRRTDGVRQAAR